MFLLAVNKALAGASLFLYTWKSSTGNLSVGWGPQSLHMGDNKGRYSDPFGHKYWKDPFLCSHFTSLYTQGDSGPGGHHPTRITLIRQFSTNWPYHDCLWLKDPMSQSAMGKVTGSFPSMHTAQARVTLCRKKTIAAEKRKFSDVTPSKGSKWPREQLKSCKTHSSVCATPSSHRSAPSQPLLHKGHKGRSVLGRHRDPRRGGFVEESSQHSLPPKLPSLSPSLRVRLASESDGSIFSHTAVPADKSLHTYSCLDACFSESPFPQKGALGSWTPSALPRGPWQGFSAVGCTLWEGARVKSE